MPIAPYKVPTLLSILAALEDMANGFDLYTMWTKIIFIACPKH